MYGVCAHGLWGQHNKLNLNEVNSFQGIRIGNIYLETPKHRHHAAKPAERLNWPERLEILYSA